MSERLWTVDRVTLHGRPRARLDSATCSISSGVTAVLGESGAGKSSLIHLLAGMESPDGGTVQRHFRGQPGQVPLYWAPQGGGLWPHLSVRQHLETVSKDDRFADRILAEFDLSHRQTAFPAELSQGECSRLAVARAVCVPTRVLLFDEPLVHVDGRRTAACWKVIRNHLRITGTDLVLTTHHPETVLREADFVICLSEGRVVWEGAVRSLYLDPPGERTGRFLGPLNWLDECAQEQWRLKGAGSCVRPECLEVSEAAVDAVGIVERCVFSGVHAETTIRHTAADVVRTFVHRPPRPLPVGTGVVLRVSAETVAP